MCWPTLPALAEAARVVGSVQIRNRATLAGNICNGSPAADTTPPQLVYGATVVVAGPDGERRVPIDDFILGAARRSTCGRASWSGHRDPGAAEPTSARPIRDWCGAAAPTLPR